MKPTRQKTAGVLAGTLAGFVVTALVAIGLAPPAAAQSADLIVKYDQSQLVRLPRPVAEIIIGNPSIADVTVKASKMLVITGKSFGITNIIALDQNLNVIQDQRVIVQRDEVATVNLQRGNARQSYNCSPQCNPTITVGDDTKWLQDLAAVSAQKRKISEASGAGTGPAQ